MNAATPLRASDVLARHEETRGASGSSCSCGDWQTVLFPGGPDIAAWSFACHQLEALAESGFEVVRRRP